MIAALVEELAIQTTNGEATGASLLAQVREAVYASTGRTKGGASSPSTRITLDVGAFTLWEDITGQIAAQYMSATDLRPNRAPEVNLLAWWTVFSAAIARGDVTDLQLEVNEDRVAHWVERIRSHFNQPTVKELLVACPECGERYVLNGDGDQVAALRATLRAGAETEAACSSCRAQWVGDDELLALGKSTGMRLDADAIRDARVPETHDSEES